MMTMHPKTYRQTTCESCLSCCLLYVASTLQPGVRHADHEVECLLYALRFSKADFTLGHLAYMTSRYSFRIHRIVEQRAWVRATAGSCRPRRITIVEKRIDLRVVDEMLAFGPVILYIDAYTLYQSCHYPHFITVLSRKHDGYDVFDPWDGKTKVVPLRALAQAIASLRSRIKLCPQALLLSTGSVPRLSAARSTGSQSEESPARRMRYEPLH